MGGAFSAAEVSGARFRGCAPGPGAGLWVSFTEGEEGQVPLAVYPNWKPRSSSQALLRASYDEVYNCDSEIGRTLPVNPSPIGPKMRDGRKPGGEVVALAGFCTV